MKKAKDGQWWSRSLSVVSGCHWHTEGGPPEGCRFCWAGQFAHRFPDFCGHPWNEVQFHPEVLQLLMTTRRTEHYLVSIKGDLGHPLITYDQVCRVLQAAYDANNARMYFPESLPFTCKQSLPPHWLVLLTKRTQRLANLIGMWHTKEEGPPPFDRSPWPEQLDSLIFMPSAWDQQSVDRACSSFSMLPPDCKTGLHLEPLLGPVELPGVRLDWVVVGGENRPGHRPCAPSWVRQIRDRCAARCIPFWFKGWGEWVPALGEHQDQVHRVNEKQLQVVDGHLMVRLGSSNTGRQINGQSHDGVPWPTVPPRQLQIESK